MKWSDFSAKQKLWIVGGILAVGGLGVILEEPKPKQKAAIVEEAEISYKKGDVKPIADYILAGVTKEDSKKVNEAQDIKDKLGIEELIRQGKVVPIEKGQKVMLIDPGFASSLFEVRVQDGSQAGRSCYIPREFFTGEFQ